MPDRLHPYDDTERRYRHTDTDVDEAIGIITKVLRLRAPPPPAGLMYDLSFYSGGIGVVDRLAITMPMDLRDAAAVAAALGAGTPAEAEADADWRDDFVWLVQDEDDPLPISAAAARFINEHRGSFLPECRASDHVWFEGDSNVNHWAALWAGEGRLSYLAYDQG